MNNTTDLRTSATLLTASVNTMCNSNNIEEVANAFVQAKDLLIAIYRARVENISK